MGRKGTALLLAALACGELAACLPSSTMTLRPLPGSKQASMRLQGGGNPLDLVLKVPVAAANVVGGVAGGLGGAAKGALKALPCFGGEEEVKKGTKKGEVKKECTSEVKKVEAAKIAPASKKNALVETYFRIVEILTLMFPVWTVVLSVVALFRPESFSWLTTEPFTMLKIGGHSIEGDLYTVFLGVIMLSMGITLTFDDFARTSQFPLPIGIGYLCQYVVKPVLGWMLAKSLNLSTPLGTGLVLLACCPGGQASNVATFIAGGDLPLSVLMTLASTVTAVFMTPLLVKVFAGASVDVDGWGMMMSVLSVVIMPTTVGLLLNQFLPGVTELLKPVTPLIGVIMTSCLCAAPIAGISDVLLERGLHLAVPVFILHTLAFGAGYLIPRYGINLNEQYSRTISIETGMQSAALGYLLAKKHFPDPLTAVPSAVGVFAMASLGSLLAVFWRAIGL